jgi:hypothetical protein
MICIAAVIGLSAAPVTAAIYHVDAVNGNDSNDGVNLPWKTLARVNAQSFLPGDQILLHAGQTWHEALAVSSSGVTGNPIIFSDYGSGPKPILEEDGVRWPAVRINGKAYVTVKYLQLQDASNVSVWVSGSSNIRIEGLLIKNSHSHGIAVDGVSPGAVIYNNVFTLDSGFKMAGSFVCFSSPVEGVTISYNNATLNGNLASSNGIFVFDVNNAISTTTRSGALLPESASMLQLEMLKARRFMPTRSTMRTGRTAMESPSSLRGLKWPPITRSRAQFIRIS